MAYTTDKNGDLGEVVTFLVRIEGTNARNQNTS
jgi:hypothetical protein